MRKMKTFMMYLTLLHIDEKQFSKDCASSIPLIIQGEEIKTNLNISESKTSEKEALILVLKSH